MIFCALTAASSASLDLRQQHDEFVAALTADRVRAPDAAPVRRRATDCSSESPIAVPQAVVDVLEAIEIEEQHGETMAVAAGQCDRLGQPVVQQHAVRQIGQEVVLRQMDGLQRQRARHAHVVEHDDGADHLPAAIVNGRGGVFDGRLDAVAPDQQAVRRQADDPCRAESPAPSGCATVRASCRR